MAIPPSLVPKRMPNRDVLNGIASDNELCHAFDYCLSAKARFVKLRDGFAPANHTVVGSDLCKAQIASSVEVVGLRLADRDRLDHGNPTHYLDLSFEDHRSTKLHDPLGRVPIHDKSSLSIGAAAKNTELPVRGAVPSLPNQLSALDHVGTSASSLSSLSSLRSAQRSAGIGS
jgi:hypothetical protein